MQLGMIGLGRMGGNMVTRLLRGLPPGAQVTNVILWETDTSRAQYRPSTGKSA